MEASQIIAPQISELVKMYNWERILFSCIVSY